MIADWMAAWRVAFRNGWDVVSIAWFCLWMLIRPQPRRTR